MKETKERMHFTLLQMLLIAFCELVFVAVIGIVSWVVDPADAVAFPWYLPLSLVLIAVLTALPSLLLYDLETSARWRLRILLHFLLLGVIVMGAGYFFGWYVDAGGAVILLVAFCAIYALVWAVVQRSYRRDDELINERLSQNRRHEDGDE